METDLVKQSDIALFRELNFQAPPSALKNLPSWDLSHLVGLQKPLPWEKTSRAIYHAALVFRMRSERALTTPREEEWRQNILKAMSAIEWRPYVSERGTHDYNNWSNGYFPGTWGLLGGDVETFHLKGTDYIRRLPRKVHWLRRSTNHGIVILVAYLIGAKALGQDLVGRELLRSVIKESFEDGCYPEGISYLSFVLSELGPYLAAGWNGQDWYSHVSAELPGIQGLKRHLRLAMNLDHQIRNSFGDNHVGIKLFHNGIRLADSLSDEGDLAPLLAQRPGNDSRLDPLVSALPAGGREAKDKTNFVFPTHIATARTDSWWLWIFGSKLHLTHNCDHDCGSFLFQNSEVYVGERPGREAYKHNVPLLKDAPGYPDCAGPDPFIKRQKHGLLRQIGEQSWRVTAPPGFDGCPTRIARHTRDLHVVDDCLVVLDRVRTEGAGEPVVQFMTTQLTSLYGHDVIGDRAHCKMALTEDGWVSASVVGATGGLRHKRGPLFIGRSRGIRFRGRSLLFPD